MLVLEIPGFGTVRTEYLVSDFTGTLSMDGILIPGVAEQMVLLTEIVRLHVVTSDTLGMVRSAMKGLPCVIHVLSGPEHDVQKEEYVKRLGCDKVIAIGNGKNDRGMLKAARIGIAVCGSEGCAVEALANADIQVGSVCDGLDLLLKPDRLKATLRF
jgi:soluble P-type ATPase